jgi:hypothetical protein
MVEKLDLDLDGLEQSLKAIGNVCLPVHATKLLAMVNRIRELERASQPGSGEAKPVAWMHVMDNTEGIKSNKPYVVFTASKKHPFGKPGIDYSESFPVTSTPLYAARASLDGRREGQGNG